MVPSAANGTMKLLARMSPAGKLIVDDDGSLEAWGPGTRNLRMRVDHGHVAGNGHDAGRRQARDARYADLSGSAARELTRSAPCRPGWSRMRCGPY